jgi:Flp pilus assembly protein TadG
MARNIVFEVANAQDRQGRRDCYGLARALANARNLLVRFRHDQSGNYAIILALTLPMLVGTLGLGTEVGLWYKKHRNLQGAADASAISAAVAYVNGQTQIAQLTLQADAVAASFGYVVDKNGVTITVNRPPKSGAYMTTPTAIEAIVQEPQPRLFSALFGSDLVPIVARSVALGGYGGPGCVLSLSPTGKSAINSVGTTSIDLKACSLYDNSSDATALNLSGGGRITAMSVGVVGGISGAANITAEKGITTGVDAVADPYADRAYPPMPAGCDDKNFKTSKTVTLNPGVFCNGMSFEGGAVVTMKPGVYYIDQGSFKVSGGATIQGDGVTIVFTSSTGNNYATADITGGSTINLTPPTSGPLSGILMFGDRNMPAGTTFKLAGGVTQNLTGSLYLPKADVQFAGGSNVGKGCTKLISNTVSFVGNANFAIDCAGYGDVAKIGQDVKLVE